jgi:hypothetical protein
MSVDTKIKILIASVLKPVDDVRSFQKIGRSLAQTNKYAVNIIGFKSKKINNCENISFHPIFNFKRTSLPRLTASWKYYKTYLKVKPQVIIISSPELLIVTYIIKILFGTTILYDVQENYRLNIRYGNNYPSLLKPILTAALKLTEHFSRYLVSGYILAEKAYEWELPFLKGRNYAVIENKVLIPDGKAHAHPISFANNSAIKMIYTGTIGREYGTLEGINLVKKLHQINSNLTLTVVGYAADSQYLELIKQSIISSSFIKLVGGNQPVPHDEIIEAIQHSDMAILPYDVNPNIKNRIPTKFYDYLAYHKPMIISKNTLWQEMLSPYPAALFVDFKRIEPKYLLQLLNNAIFYELPPNKDIYWDSEAQKLIGFLNFIKLK